MKKFFSFFIALITVFSSLAVPCALAQEAPSANEPQVIQYDDGSYLVVAIETSYARVAGVTKTKYATYHAKNGDVEWKMALNGTELPQFALLQIARLRFIILIGM